MPNGHDGTIIPDPLEEEIAPDAGKVRLTSHFTQKGANCLYVYDFGDGWHHVVEFKQVAEMPERFTRRLVDGARAFPPEDCGGVWGYARCLAALGLVDAGDFDAGDLEETREWLGDWNPEEFDLASVRDLPPENCTKCNESSGRLKVGKELSDEEAQRAADCGEVA